MQLYIKHLVHERLSSKAQLDAVAGMLERLPWHEEEEFIGRCLLQQVTLHAKFSEMDVFAILLASFKRHHRGFVVALVDQLLEEVLRACERNDFKEAQRRVALAKFLGECFNFRVVHTSTLFEVLYRLINERCQEHMKAMDSPQDSFRIRLVCTTLDSLGKGYFQRGPRRKMMDRFLMYF